MTKAVFLTEDAGDWLPVASRVFNPLKLLRVGPRNHFLTFEISTNLR